MRFLPAYLLSAGICLSLLFSASCKKDDSGPDIAPKGTAPVWGPDIHKEMLTVIEQLDSFNVPPLESLTPQDARMQLSIFDAARLVASRYGILDPVATADTFSRDIPVTGGIVHARIYKPHSGSGPFPAIVYYHGGGWVIATINTYDASSRALAEQTGAIVISVEYRKGPEYKFPTAHNDAFEAYKWIVNNASGLSINPSKLAVAGESAGGNLACYVSIAARDNGLTMPKHQLLIYPVAQTDLNTASYIQYAAAKPLNKPLITWFLGNYFNNTGESADPRISLVNANLSGLPATTIINAGIDPLRDDGQQLEAKLKAAGVSVDRRIFDGVTHEFFGLATVLPEAREAQAMGSAILRTALQ